MTSLVARRIQVSRRGGGGGMEFNIEFTRIDKEIFGLSTAAILIRLLCTKSTDIVKVALHS